MTATHDEILYPILTTSQIGYLLQKGQEIAFKSGEIIFAEGSPADAVYIILEGRIRVTRKVGADETLVVIDRKSVV